MLMKAGGQIMSAAEYEESLRRYQPTVYVDGDLIESVVDEPRLQPGIRAVGVTYDFAQRPEYGGLMLADQASSGKTVNRMLHINRHSEDLLSKLEAVRLICRESGCAQRYLTHDALNAIHQATWQISEDTGGEQYERFLAYLHRVQDEDLTLGVAMTDGKGDRSKRPADQVVADSYVISKSAGLKASLFQASKPL
jgi:4-hydroxybutyryl-CoA dehydratase/vinylacetyl-CoA-Delta-isomerase